MKKNLDYVFAGIIIFLLGIIIGGQLGRRDNPRYLNWCSIQSNPEIQYQYMQDYINATEQLLDRVYEDNDVYFLDVLMEDQEYDDYRVALDNILNQETW